MEIEIERKWLVSAEQYREFVNWLDYVSTASSCVIMQRYLRKNEVEFINGEFVISDFENKRQYIIKAPDDIPDLTGANLRKFGARVRQTMSNKSSSLEFTIKLPLQDGSKREINIPLEDGYRDFITNAHTKDINLNEHGNNTATGFIIKRRWSGELDEVHYDADKFMNRPFYIIEAEFQSVDEADSFVAPFEFIREVTDDNRFSNKRMSWNIDNVDTTAYNIRLYADNLIKEANALRGDTLVSMRESVTNEFMAERYEKIARDLKQLVGEQ
ncbi:hypothetical protein VPFG_00294 [Vibrio phage nt-1]|uniref:CYTH domain-containing protein n=1 Tax=Vibrio phage nt-1 TaxID=115992 RepID=R9TGR3_9CAUD|nr:hypothetical protein VPFG_00294 [Vibrio phage nt-1]AGN30293.2 hypothetical protein VPFG_00294 [Vibrio phage nt-1]